MENFRLLGFSSSILVLIILLTTNGGVSVQNVFGSIENSVDEIVESAEDRGDQAREEAEDTAEEATEDSDDEVRDRDSDEDEDEDEDEDKKEDTVNGDDSSDETSLINKFASDPGEDGEDGRAGPTGIGKDESEVPSGIGEGSGMQIFVSPRERVNEILDQHLDNIEDQVNIQEDFAFHPRTIRDSIPDPTNTIAPDGGLQGTNPELASPLDMLGAITFDSAVGNENLQGTNPDGIIEGSLNILFPTGGFGAGEDSLPNPNNHINNAFRIVDIIPIDVDDIFPTGGVGASPGDVPIVPRLGLTFDEDFNTLDGGSISGREFFRPDFGEFDPFDGSNILFPTGGVGANPDENGLQGTNPSQEEERARIAEEIAQLEARIAEEIAQLQNGSKTDLVQLQGLLSRLNELSTLFVQMDLDSFLETQDRLIPLIQ